MSDEQVMKPRSFPQIFAGAGMGLLVGLIIGLSVSPVVQVILGALASLLGAFLGLQDWKISEQGATLQDGANQAMIKATLTGLRMGSFGFAVAAGILLGIFFRTHGVLSVPVEQEVAKWIEAGYSADYARKLVAFEKLGINPETGTVEATTALQNKGQTVLFSDLDAQKLCDDLEPSQYGENIETILEAYRAYGDDAVVNLAGMIEKMPPDQQLPLHFAVWEVICGFNVTEQ